MLVALFVALEDVKVPLHECVEEVLKESVLFEKRRSHTSSLKSLVEDLRKNYDIFPIARAFDRLGL